MTLRWSGAHGRDSAARFVHAIRTPVRSLKQRSGRTIGFAWVGNVSVERPASIRTVSLSAHVHAMSLLG
jgi:hypothetical protein